MSPEEREEPKNAEPPREGRETKNDLKTRAVNKYEKKEISHSKIK